MRLDVDGTQVLFIERDDQALVVALDVIDGVRVGTHTLLDSKDAVCRVKNHLRDLAEAPVTS